VGEGERFPSQPGGSSVGHVVIPTKGKARLGSYAPKSFILFEAGILGGKAGFG